MFFSRLDTDFVKESLLMKTTELRNILEDLQIQMSGQSPRSIVSYVRLCLEIFDKTLSVRLANFPDYKNEEEQNKRLYTFLRKNQEIINWLQESFFPYISPVLEEYVILELLPSLQETVVKLNKSYVPNKTFEISIRPYWANTIEITTISNLIDHFIEITGANSVLPKEYLNKIQDGEHDLPERVIIIRYPYMAANMMYLYPLFHHEISHVKDREEDITEKLLLDVVWKEVEKKKVLEHIEDLSDDEYQDLQKSIRNPLPIKFARSPEDHLRTQFIFIKQSVKILKRWINEIFADLLATRLIGPAYLFSFIDFIPSIGKNVDVFTDKYPSQSYRLLEIMNCLDDMGYFDQSQTDEEICKSLEKCRAELKEIGRKKPTKFRYEIPFGKLDPIIPKIHFQAKHSSSDLEYYSTLYKEQVKYAELELKKGFPPISHFSPDDGSIPRDTRAIVNAAWKMYFVNGIDEYLSLFENNNLREKLDSKKTFSSLMNKGIESSQILNYYKNLTK